MHRMRAILRGAQSMRVPAHAKSASRDFANAQHFTAPPAAEPLRHTTIRHYLYYRIRDVLVRQYKRTCVNFVATTTLGCAAAAYVWQKQSSDSGKTRILNTFERGAVGGYWPADASSAVEREDLHEQLVRLLRPRSTFQYAVVLGAHGTGKSTAIRKAARDSMIANDCVNGVVYYLVDYPANFSTGLAALFNCRNDSVNIMGCSQGPLSQETKYAKLPAARDEPRASWMLLYPQLLQGATAFRQAHGRPATLVLDGVDVIAEVDPAFHDMLQIFAKRAADAGVMRVVFVSSDGAAPERIESRSKWSRAADPVEVGDISDSEAVNFLVSAYKAKPDVAALTVDRIAGGRFEMLVRYATLPNVAAVMSKTALLELKLEGSLDAVGVPRNHAFFRALAATNRVNSSLRRKTGISTEMLSSLLKANIIVAHPDETFSFHSRFVKRYFEGILAQDVVSAAQPCATFAPVMASMNQCNEK